MEKTRFFDERTKIGDERFHKKTLEMLVGKGEEMGICGKMEFDERQI